MPAHRKMASFTLLCLSMFWLSILFSGPLRGEVALSFSAFRGTLAEPEGSEKIFNVFVDTGRAHIGDDHGWDFTLRLDREELIFVEHADKVYSRVPIPGRFEDYIGPAAQEFYDRRGIEPDWIQTAKVEKTGEIRRFGEWRAERVEIDVRDSKGGKAEHLTLWMSTDLEVDLTPLEELQRHRAYVSESSRRYWIDQLVDLEGFPIVQTTTRFTKRGDFTHTIRLDAVIEKEVDSSIYEPPEGYEKVRFRSVRYAVPQPLP